MIHYVAAFSWSWWPSDPPDREFVGLPWRTWPEFLDDWRELSPYFKAKFPQDRPWLADRVERCVEALGLEFFEAETSRGDVSITDVLIAYERGDYDEDEDEGGDNAD